MQIQLSHVALLVPSTQKATEHLRQFNFQIGPDEFWEGEGTKEVYIEREKGNSLLLMEPFKDGAYKRALEKRGPGIHHLAIDVTNIETYIESLAQSGWLLHPRSLKTIKQVKTAYLARPGFPALIEVQENKTLEEKPLFVNLIELPFDSSLEKLLLPIGCENVVKKNEGELLITLFQQKIKFSNLL